MGQGITKTQRIGETQATNLFEMFLNEEISPTDTPASNFRSPPGLDSFTWAATAAGAMNLVNQARLATVGGRIQLAIVTSLAWHEPKVWDIGACVTRHPEQEMPRRTALGSRNLIEGKPNGGC